MISPRKQMLRLGWLVCIFAAFISPQAARATDGVWINPVGGSWNTASNWSGNNIASGPDSTADFSTLNLLTNATVQVGTSYQVGTMLFGSGTPFNWTLDNNGNPANVVTLSNGFIPIIYVANQTTTVNLTLTGVRGMDKAGAGTLLINTPATYAGNTFVDQGTLKSGVNNVLPVATNLGVSAGATFDLNGHGQQVASLLDGGVITNSSLTPGTLTVNVSGGGQNTDFMTIQGNLSFVKAGLGNLTLTTPMAHTGGTFVSEGRFKSGVNGLLPEAGSLTVSSGRFDLNGHFQKIRSVTIGGTSNAWTGKVDVSSSTLVVQATSPADKSAKLAQLTNQVVAAYNGGDWQGNGVTSSSVAADATHNTTLAIADNADTPGRTTFAGMPVDSNSLIVTRALLGDADLSNVVDASDFDAWFRHVGASTQSYGSADWDHSGVVDASDFDIWFRHIGLSGLPTVSPESETAVNPAPVPEPATLVMAFASGMLLMNRRPRRRAGAVKFATKR